MSKAHPTILLMLALAVVGCSDDGAADSPRPVPVDTATQASETTGNRADAADDSVPADTAIPVTGAPATRTPVDAMRDRSTAVDTTGHSTTATGDDPVEPESIRDSAAPAPAAAQDPARLLRRTAGIYSAMNSLRAEFSMLTRNPLLQTRASSRGTLYQRRPDRIKLDFTDPAGDVIVGDGTWFWVFYPSVDAKQVIRTPAAGTAGVVDLQAQFVGDPLTRFDHTAEGRESVNGRDATILSLVPRENLGYAKLKVWIDDADFLVRRFEITDPNGVTRLLDLTGLVIDPALPDGLFTFTPPAGARIVERE